jgi:hypothetical protein
MEGRFHFREQGMPSANTFRSIFGWMMGFVAMTWVWAVALIMAWPWEKAPKWEPELRLVASCKDREACSIPYGKLAEGRAQGLYSSLQPPEPIGEVQESDAWLRWKTVADKPWQFEVTRSSWYFETTVRYRFDGDTPVLVELKRYDADILLYAIPLALTMVVGMYFRSLRGS